MSVFFYMYTSTWLEGKLYILYILSNENTWTRKVTISDFPYIIKKVVPCMLNYLKRNQNL